ncbi:hypothetical protein [Methylobacterium sp. WSM2598]|uniref:hypothetical protein n=1 Tax=Methylobacterium sp. WSM2598 TaxID=398261 RepID=UPI00039BC485|nr:hypothetical protein [Methylobacterium sp. WSM2598]
MNPVEYLRDFAKQYPTQGAILASAIACFAAVALIEQFGTRLESAIPAVVYVLAVGVVLFLLVRFLSEPIAQRASGWFIALLIVAWLPLFVWSRSRPENERLACVVYFWLPCRIAADAAASQAQAAPPAGTPAPAKPAGATAAPAGPAAEARAKYQVYIQFAGFPRPAIAALANALAAQGWAVQGAGAGGERVAAAATLAEVRYGDPAAKPAAEALAAALNQSGIVPRTVRAVPLAIIRPNVLEVWIGQ